MQIPCRPSAERGEFAQGATIQSTMANGRIWTWWLAVMVGCSAAEDDTPADTSSSGTTAAAPVSYAACDDPQMGCAGDDCRRRDDAAGAWSVCVPPCTEDADCPIGGGGNVQVVCDPEGRCVLECVPQIMSCPSGTTCVDGATPQCMWPG